MDAEVADAGQPLVNLLSGRATVMLARLSQALARARAFYSLSNIDAA
jgi:hypothetical protein